MSVYIGIDVAARSFDLLCRRDGKNSKVYTFPQTAQGHAQAIRKLQALQPAGIVLEATGIYYLDLALALHEAGLPVSVINPRSFRHFAEITLRGSKTDPLDTALLAEYAERMTPRRWTPPPSTYRALRDFGRHLNRLMDARTQAKNHLHALKAQRGTPALLIEDAEESIAQLDQRIERVQQAAQDLIQQTPELAQHQAHLCAATGLAAASSLALLAELSTLPRDLKAKQVARHAGLDVRLHESGSSVHRPGRLAKTGNAYLRSALYMPAMVAIVHDPYAKAFYNALVARGKKRIQALCAVMRKYLTGIWACMQHDQPFDSSKLFSDQHLQTA
ncbi:MAG: IS110 family transposase [Gammaproteobacteria bacterium]|nr:IS110 family transposase [Gammaproteobacteria bacterium]MDZ7750290.1 IS110 family transposase [Gammaproteobacteria bacterium]MDZ7752442.1 IS110 family transposase [Gammaproteobacteria bacterium]MDZ7753094.1 IS110 family transposase [Gammaproteobacteria bacterium]MDZ7753349.1 IS110 family transposase [Gammaproteobacteria bacterium]